ncbi:hypothetical protein AAC387_Pa06g1877 [Persea americana]
MDSLQIKYNDSYTTSVTCFLVAPSRFHWRYYAERAAYRGRLYLESLTDCRWAASTSSSSTLSLSTSPDFDHINFPKVLTDLENRMIFI